MAVAIAIIVILALAVGTILVLAANRQRAHDGPALARDEAAATPSTRRRRGDRASTSTELETTGRERADDTRADLRERARDARPRRRRRRGSRSTRRSSASPAGSSSTAASSTCVGFSVAGFGAACLGFLWPTGSAGFGGKIDGGQDQRHRRLHRRASGALLHPRGARLRPAVPAGRPARRRRRSTAPVTYAGMEQGYRRPLPEVRAPRLPRPVVPDARSGSSARATARSTTGSARRRPARRPVASTASRSP